MKYSILALLALTVAISGCTDQQMCAQVITPAINPENGEIVEFPTPCDVPEGWEIVRGDDPRLMGPLVSIQGTDLFFKDQQILNYSFIYANHGTSFYYLELPNKKSETYQYSSIPDPDYCKVSSSEDPNCLGSLELLRERCIYNGTIDPEDRYYCM